MCTYCVISATSFRLQIFMTGNVVSCTTDRDTFVLTRLVAMNATKYVDMFGVIWKSSRIYSELGILVHDNQHGHVFNEFFLFYKILHLLGKLNKIKQCELPRCIVARHIR